MTWTAVGSPVTDVHNAIGAASYTIAVSPTATGDILVISAGAYGGAYAGGFNTPTGGGVTTWVPLAQNVSSNSSSKTWYGIVTSTGSSNVTMNPTSTGGNVLCRTAIQQFHNSTSTTFSIEATNTASFSGVTSGNYPSLSPSGSDELYVAGLEVYSISTGGATSGFTYIDVTGGGYLGAGALVYYLGAASPNAYSPAWTIDTPQPVLTCSALIKAASPGNLIFVV